MTVPQRASTAILKWMMLNADGDEIARIVDEAAEFRLSDSPGVDVEQFVARALLSWRTGQWPMLSASDLEALGYAIFGENEGLWSARLYGSVLCLDGLDRLGVPSSTAEYYCNVVAAAQYWMDPSLITCAGQLLSDMATRTDDDARFEPPTPQDVERDFSARRRHLEQLAAIESTYFANGTGAAPT